MKRRKPIIKSVIWIDPVLGEMRVLGQFKEVLKLKYFSELKEKSQLGPYPINGKIPHEDYTRENHSKGTALLLLKLFENLEEKYPDFKITRKQKKILFLAFLAHDIGHLACSHGLEYILKKKHEYITIERLYELESDLDRIFGFKITREVIKILKNTLGIALSKEEKRLDSVVNMFIPLLSSTVDFDRMNYMLLDSIYTLGKCENYEQILDGIAIHEEYGIVYESSVKEIIVRLLEQRVKRYKDCFYAEKNAVREHHLQQFLRNCKFTEKKIKNISEKKIVEMVETASIYSSDREQNDLAKIILGKSDKIYSKSFMNQKEILEFKDKINEIVGNFGNVEYIDSIKRKIILYKETEPVYIIDNNGTVSELSVIMPELKQEPVKINIFVLNVHERYSIPQDIQEKLIEVFTK